MSTQAPHVRLPAVAGRFYPGDAAELGSEVEGYLAAARGQTPGQAVGGEAAGLASRSAAGEESASLAPRSAVGEESAGLVPRSAFGVMAPHAGYVYSGGVAGQVFGRTEVPPRVVILCPNHTGMGRPIAVADRGVFRMPGADVPVDAELAAAVLAEVPGAEADFAAHRMEHAIEVELPFLLARQPGLRIVPVVLGMLREHEAMDVGRGLYRAVQRVGAVPGQDVLVVASSDMSHYLSDREARRVDRVALEPLLAFDASGLYRTVTQQRISMCGFVPATALLTFAREAGATQPPELVAYATSGDAFGDRTRVVGYAGVMV